MEEKLANEIYTLIQNVIQNQGLELYDIEYDGKKLRVYIDTPKGVTIETCAELSNDLSCKLDALDILSGPYTLEVSSPGVERKLKTLVHFQKVIGKRVLIITKNLKIVGKVMAVEGSKIILKVLTGSSIKDGQVITVDHSEIKKAFLKVDSKELFRK